MNPRNVIEKLLSPGLMVAFLDDSGTSGNPIATLAEDTKFVCAVVMQSDEYREVHLSLTEWLERLGVSGFHATEIFNPESDSQWHAKEPGERVMALQFLYDMLAAADCRLLWCPISSEQFSELRAEAQLRRSVSIGQKAALARVVHNALIVRFQNYGDGRLAIVCEDDKGKEQVRLQPLGKELFAGGIIHARKSAGIRGLELADAAAFLLNRVHHTHSKDSGDLNSFDRLIAKAWKSLSPKFELCLTQ